MAIQVGALDSNRVQHNVSIDKRPDVCPLCHHAIELLDQFSGFYNKADLTVQLIHRCPRLSCQSAFIANYFQNRQSGQFYLTNSTPTNHAPRHFSETIKNTSKEFCEIYNQSLASELNGHLKICGVGYRKSLEFLLKDYLIGLNPDKADEIKGKFLGKCIDEYVSNTSSKAVAKRAVWLGNDETHYVRIWEGKDLKDLKKLVDLTVHWIEMEQLTHDAMKEMPENSR